MLKYTKKDIEELYNYYEENEAKPATKAVMEANDKVYDSLDEYIAEVKKFGWICGFQQALKMLKDGLL